ncbi:hypothetical protein SAMN05216215_11047 [Saccharopolyspora shandongensis]|uniref:Uncharacterized protein n=1 Tax=Saccharopolyspora shandongensis TaxID=418495 RepID=A0A1H3U389_9PSEU|nr:hypothetical protein SAMN05216215_11047 [Saccharopolyspora shandongensis]
MQEPVEDGCGSALEIGDELRGAHTDRGARFDTAKRTG